MNCLASQIWFFLVFTASSSFTVVFGMATPARAAIGFRKATGPIGSGKLEVTNNEIRKILLG
jgi:hypothetical protein